MGVNDVNKNFEVREKKLLMGKVCFFEFGLLGGGCRRPASSHLKMVPMS